MSAGRTDGKLRILTGWGRYPRVRARLRLSEDLRAITTGAVLSHGLGRAYGDAALPADEGAPVACTRLADRVIGFDETTGVLHAEAGLALETINRVWWPRGWSSPVLPGTQRITLGGMVAADVHGKNHHAAGSTGHYVESLVLRTAAGRIVTASPEIEPELFDATIGGMGLTGHILEVRLRLERIPSPWVLQEIEPAADLDDLLARLGRAGRDWPYTMAWSDLLAGGRHRGRGLVIKGRWAEPGETPAEAPRPPGRRAVPFEAPGFLLNRLGGRLFNGAYHLLGRMRAGARIVPPEPFFHPLDIVDDWNLLYGSAGFTQYQCVVPAPAERFGAGLIEILRAGGVPPFLVVVKDFGQGSRGMLSFPMPGITFSIDLPIRLPRLRDVVDRVNESVVAAGGRIYLAKDAFTRREHFAAMERERLGPWNRVRRTWDPEGRLQSALAARLLDPPSPEATEGRPQALPPGDGS